ncbi:uncharacterized protein EV422DRAFT_137254 [Fimicolochytrium jonesii]|uniref:uncharacterized protein n=1 Tax=Fimicolochytrium jonesii TaxID=1396493 RepID=UPI0022FEFA13|nr:uncharacterized protein EV422DRAFT_137254 [Fimicolochytrium jonesii]KAI8825700.1 hypothetical protein EV422DRAFT_137254 [Fimicolochytrium jonesii]
MPPAVGGSPLHPTVLASTMSSQFQDLVLDSHRASAKEGSSSMNLPFYLTNCGLAPLATRAISTEDREQAASATQLLEELNTHNFEAFALSNLNEWASENLPQSVRDAEPFRTFMAKRPAEYDLSFWGADDPIMGGTAPVLPGPKCSVPNPPRETEVDQEVFTTIKEAMVLRYVQNAMDKIDPFLYRLLPDRDELRQNVTARLLSLITVDMIIDGSGGEWFDECIHDVVQSSFRDDLACARLAFVLHMLPEAHRDTLRIIMDILILDAWKVDEGLSEKNADHIMDTVKQASKLLSVPAA